MNSPTAWTLDTVACIAGLVFDQVEIEFGATIAEELPGVSDLANHIEIDFVDQQFVIAVTGLRLDRAAM